jgi:hypothetical protein
MVEMIVGAVIFGVGTLLGATLMTVKKEQK